MLGSQYSGVQQCWSAGHRQCGNTVTTLHCTVRKTSVERHTALSRPIYIHSAVEWPVCRALDTETPNLATSVVGPDAQYTAGHGQSSNTPHHTVSGQADTTTETCNLPASTLQWSGVASQWCGRLHTIIETRNLPAFLPYSGVYSVLGTSTKSCHHRFCRVGLNSE